VDDARGDRRRVVVDLAGHRQSQLHPVAALGRPPAGLLQEGDGVALGDVDHHVGGVVGLAGAGGAGEQQGEGGGAERAAAGAGGTAGRVHRVLPVATARGAGIVADGGPPRIGDDPGPPPNPGRPAVPGYRSNAGTKESGRVGARPDRLARRPDRSVPWCPWQRSTAPSAVTTRTSRSATSTATGRARRSPSTTTTSSA